VGYYQPPALPVGFPGDLKCAAGVRRDDQIGPGFLDIGEFPAA
jgi:hypothetical protein